MANSVLDSVAGALPFPWGTSYRLYDAMRQNLADDAGVWKEADQHGRPYGGILGALYNAEIPSAREAARKIEAGPDETDCVRVWSGPLGADRNGENQPDIAIAVGDATRGLYPLDFNHQFIANRDGSFNIGFYPDGLRTLPRIPPNFRPDPTLGGICMDKGLLEGAVRDVVPGIYSLPFNNCQHYAHRLIRGAAEKKATPSGGSGW